jgi:hypothetical protein
MAAALAPSGLRVVSACCADSELNTARAAGPHRQATQHRPINENRCLSITQVSGLITMPAARTLPDRRSYTLLMADRWTKSAPPGADTKSWRY